MDKKTITNDPLLLQLYQRKQLRPATIRLYESSLYKYCTLINKTPSELRHEAYHEQINQPDKLSRKINTYLIQYHNSLIQEGLSRGSIKTLTDKIRAFYNEYDIELPKRIIFREEKRITKKSDLITIDTIRQAVQDTPNLKYKSIFLLLATSGMRSGDLRNLRIKDFMEAMGYPEQPINTLFTKKEIKETIPCFEYLSQKTNEHTITFITPEARDYTIQYLKTRPEANINDYLFLSRDHLQYTKTAITSIFRHTNNRHNWGYKTNNHNRLFFHAHGLRGFFSTILNNNGVPYSIYKKMMGQTLKGVDTAYINVDRESCQREYTRCINDLSINKVEVYDFKTDEYLRLEKDNQIKEDRLKELEKKDKMREEQMKRVLDELKLE
jgi:integrase